MKKKNKIILSIFLSCLGVLFLTLILYLEIPRISYSYNEKNDSYYIEYVFGNYTELKLENEHNGKKVTGIKRYALSKQSNLKTIYLNKDLIEIDSVAFYGCNSLENIYFNENLKCIRNNAFLGCKSLKEIDLSNSLNLTQIEGSVFFDCVSLKIVKLPNIPNISIGDYAFFNTNIESLYLNKDVYLYPNALNSIDLNNIKYY